LGKRRKKLRNEEKSILTVRDKIFKKPKRNKFHFKSLYFSLKRSVDNYCVLYKLISLVVAVMGTASGG
jgi:hypothetical protein